MNKEELSSIEQTAIMAADIFAKLPLAYKQLIASADWLMVLGGIKAATDYMFVGDTWNASDFEALKQVLASSGIKVSEPLDNGVFKTGWIWNSSVVCSLTAATEFAPPYNGTDDLQVYIDQAQALGYPVEAVAGKLFSFPDSAIGDFLAVSSNTGAGKQGQIETEFARGEAYWHFEPAQPDVVAREALKTTFFTKLNDSSTFKRILESDDLALSKKEWQSRLPKELKTQ